MIRMKRHSTTDRVLYTGRHGSIKLTMERRPEDKYDGKEIFDIRILRPNADPLIAWAFIGKGKALEFKRSVQAFGSHGAHDPAMKDLIETLTKEGVEFIERRTA